jgi:cytochrome c-type biogenesis protein CcmE
MKKVYIIAGIMVAVAVSFFVMASEDLSTYATIAEAQSTGERVKITGQLAKDMDMHYDPATDPNYFSFYIRDKDEKLQKVVLLQPKPQDFEMSESIVLTGRVQGDEFVATDVLLKCPSKYKDEQLNLDS